MTKLRNLDACRLEQGIWGCEQRGVNFWAGIIAPPAAIMFPLSGVGKRRYRLGQEVLSDLCLQTFTTSQTANDRAQILRKRRLHQKSLTRYRNEILFAYSKLLN